MKKYKIIVNGEWLLTTTSYEKALEIESQYYSNDDEDFINYYGNFVDVRIIEFEE